MLPERYIELYQKRLSAIRSNILEKLRNQRNKIYAHNDLELCFDVERFLESNPICYKDMETLVDLALDICRFVIGWLTGIQKAETFSNIDDWENSLRLVRIGYKYMDYEAEQQLKSSEKTVERSSI